MATGGSLLPYRETPRPSVFYSTGVFGGSEAFAEQAPVLVRFFRKLLMGSSTSNSACQLPAADDECS